MQDDLTPIVLKNYLYHLDTNFADNLVTDLLVNKTFHNYEKMDILFIINFALTPNVPEYNKTEIYQRIHDIIIRLNELSKYEYTDEELYRLQLLYYMKYIIHSFSFNKEDLQELINQINDVLDGEIIENNNEILLNYLNEELRIYALQLYEQDGDIYAENETIVRNYLNLALENSTFRRNIAEILEQ